MPWDVPCPLGAWNDPRGLMDAYSELFERAELAMNLKEPEIAYLRRFCWEVFHQANGPETTSNRCPCHYNDLADLAATTNLAQEIVQAAYDTDYQDTPPPVVPFPWASLEALHFRAEALRNPL
jgi:hypothetical protein